jgi:hypothetical protein
MRKTLTSLLVTSCMLATSYAQQTFDPAQLTRVDAHQTMGVWSFMYKQTMYTGHKQNRAFFASQPNGQLLDGYRRAHRTKVWGDITGFTGGVFVGLGGLLILDKSTRRDGGAAIGVGTLFLVASTLLERSANQKLARVLILFNQDRGGLGISTGRSQQQLHAGFRIRL